MVGDGWMFRMGTIVYCDTCGWYTEFAEARDAGAPYRCSGQCGKALAKFIHFKPEERHEAYQLMRKETAHKTLLFYGDALESDGEVMVKANILNMPEPSSKYWVWCGDRLIRMDVAMNITIDVSADTAAQSSSSTPPDGQ